MSKNNLVNCISLGGGGELLTNGVPLGVCHWTGSYFRSFRGKIYLLVVIEKCEDTQLKGD